MLTRTFLGSIMPSPALFMGFYLFALLSATGMWLFHFFSFGKSHFLFTYMFLDHFLIACKYFYWFISLKCACLFVPIFCAFL